MYTARPPRPVFTSFIQWQFCLDNSFSTKLILLFVLQMTRKIAKNSFDSFGQSQSQENSLKMWNQWNCKMMGRTKEEKYLQKEVKENWGKLCSCSKSKGRRDYRMAPKWTISQASWRYYDVLNRRFWGGRWWWCWRCDVRVNI